jgi:arylsulfatase A-like enzyme
MVANVAALPLEVNWNIRDRVFFAALFGVIDDGVMASYLTAEAHASRPVVLLAGLEVACFLAFPVTILSLPVAFLLNTPGARILGRYLRRGLSGDRPEYAHPALILFAIAMGISACASWRLGLRVAEVESPRVATLVTMASSLTFAFGGALSVAAVVHPVGSLVHRLFPRVAWLPLKDLMLAAVGQVTLLVLLPRLYVNSPAALLFGFALGPWIASNLRGIGKVDRLPVPMLLAGTSFLSMGASGALKRLPALAQSALLERAPYASLVSTNLRNAIDHDHDGYSPILGGGDCDDRDPNVHPNAIDIPDNGIDEDCSGVDAHRYIAPVPSNPGSPGAHPMRDNVVLIHLDTVRPDHVGFVGYSRKTTPRIDRFREGATWFKNAYTPGPSTRFALGTLFTGLDIDRIPWRRGVANDVSLLPQAATLAGRLAHLGYDRVGYTISWVFEHFHNAGQGFRVWETPWPHEDWESVHPHSAERTTSAAVRYLASMPEDGSKPFLLFVQYECAHDPYAKHAPWDYGDRDIDRYDSALSYCDDQLGPLLDTLNGRGDRDKTAVFLFSDHGELFEHGFTNHGNTAFQPDVRVLLLARIPGSSVKEIDTPMLLTDIHPTVLELTGLPANEQSAAWDLLPYLLRGESMPPRPLFLHADNLHNGVHFDSKAVVDGSGRWKYIRDVRVGTDQLYDLAVDPSELSDLADEAPTVRDSLKAMAEGWEASENATR